MLPANPRPALVDPSFPHLRAALDSDAMLKVFRDHLRPRADKLYEVRGCRLTRIRHRAAFRCVLQYTLRIAEAPAGTERDLLISGAMYADESEVRQRWEKLRARGPDCGVPEHLLTFDSASFIPDLGMLVQVFPFDRRLPTLPLLAAGPPPEIEGQLLSRLGPGDWRAVSWNTTTVRYREYLGAVLRYDLRACDTAGASATRSFYAKVYRDASGERTLRQIEVLRSILDTKKGPAVGAPVAYLDRLRALLLEEAPGVSLEEVLLRDLDVAAAIRRVARDVARFNQLDIVPERLYPLADYASSLERSARLLGWACPRHAAPVNDMVAAIADGLKEVPPRPTHRDLKPDHVFIHGDRTVFIDLDSFAGADPVLDPALLLARLAAMPDLLPVPRARTRMAADVFAEEYFARVPNSWRETLHLHYAGALLEVAHGFFRRQERDWPAKVANLIRQAEEALEGGTRW